MKRTANGQSDLLGSEQLTITPLGAGSEVGRSCIVVRFKGKTIMLDCGIHPAHSGLAALPFFDEIDPESVDLVLITQYISRINYQIYTKSLLVSTLTMLPPSLILWRRLLSRERFT